MSVGSRSGRIPGLARLAALAWLTLPAAGCATPTPSPTPTPTATATATGTPTATATPTLSPTPTFPRDAVVNIEALNVREGPDVLHPIHAVVYRATAVAVEGQDADGAWLAVRLTDGRRGWLNGAYVDLGLDPAAIPLKATPSPPPTPIPTPIPMDPSLPLVVVPPVVAQGEPFLVRFRAPEAAQGLAVFQGFELPLQRASPDSFAVLLTAPLDSPTGDLPIHLTAIDAGGGSRAETAMVTVRTGGHTEESVQLGADREPLLDPGLGEAEVQRMLPVWTQIGPERLWNGRWGVPVQGGVTSPFGSFRDYNSGRLLGRHTGMDLRGRSGDPVYAPAAGRVAAAEELPIRGRCVWLDHGWGLYSGYCHLSSIGVQPGQTVVAGTYLGAIGTTGRSTAPHLHWEVRIHGQASSPVQWLWRDVGAVP